MYEINIISVNTCGGFAARYVSLTRICLFDGCTKEILSKLFYKLSATTNLFDKCPVRLSHNLKSANKT